jgi:hypothetical protein
MFGEYHDYHLGVLENDLVSGQYVQNLKHNKNLDGTQGSKHSRLLFMGAITFMQATNKRDAFLICIYIYWHIILKHRTQDPFLIQRLQGCFQKNNVNTLLDY